MIYDWSVHVFGYINAVPAHSGVLMAAKFVSSWALILAFTALAALLTARHKRNRGPLILALAAVFVAMIANILIGKAMALPRPFVLGIGQQLVEHKPTPSFPSNHGTYLFALAFGLLWTQASRLFGWVALAFAVASSWSRIYLGVHFPIDIMGSAVLAALAAAPCGWIAVAIRRRVHRPDGPTATEATIPERSDLR